MQDLADESGVAKVESVNKKLQEDIEALSEGLRFAMAGKDAAETRVVGLMGEVEDKQETVEHLQVVVSELEFNMNLKIDHNQTLSEEVCPIHVCRCVSIFRKYSRRTNSHAF